MDRRGSEHENRQTNDENQTTVLEMGLDHLQYGFYISSMIYRERHIVATKHSIHISLLLSIGTRFC